TIVEQRLDLRGVACVHCREVLPHDFDRFGRRPVEHRHAFCAACCEPDPVCARLRTVLRRHGGEHNTRPRVAHNVNFRELRYRSNQPTISSSPKKKSISILAFSSLSEPWTVLASMLSAKVLRIVP